MSVAATRRPRSRAALHLLWTIPLATVLAIPVYVVGALDLCGVSGCSGGGFGRFTDDQPISWVCCFLIGALYFLSLVFVPWVRHLGLRMILSAAVGGLLGAVVALQYQAALPHS